MTALYIDQSLKQGARIDSAILATFTERHHFRLPTVKFSALGDFGRELADPGLRGVLFSLTGGLPGREVMRYARAALKSGRSVYLYWPTESAVEVIDHERLASLSRHRVAYVLGKRIIRWVESRRRLRHGAATAVPVMGGAAPVDLTAEIDAAKFIAADYEGTLGHLRGGFGEIKRIAALLETLASFVKELHGEDGGQIQPLSRNILNKVRAEIDGLQQIAASTVTHMEGGDIALARIEGNIRHLVSMLDHRRTSVESQSAPNGDPIADDYRRALAEFASHTSPIPFAALKSQPTPSAKIRGTGVYVRSSYWAHMVSGGSYGHTCYVAKELAEITDHFTCLLGSSYPLLDTFGIDQEVIQPPFTATAERDLLVANAFYYEALREKLVRLKPAYIYERLVLGNYVCARLSAELKIPYIVEYNGSEISMSRSFGSGALAHEDLFIEAERMAFEQATAIVAISDPVALDIISRGIDAGKVIVNPNGVNCDDYAPASAKEKMEIKTLLGFKPDDRVIAFIGTFGGWHGIDVLAAALEPVCRTAPEARFLLIGDGNLKHLVTDRIREQSLQDKVLDVGRTDQQLGAHYLRAADIYISPHASHMTDSKFFGSPTKLFEYMALAGGIVASDLEQIGVILSPALRPSDFTHGVPDAARNRAVLCKPGDIDDFIAGVVALVRHPEICSALGQNARAAAREHFSWKRHVDRIWEHVQGEVDDQSWRQGAAKP